MSEELSLTVIPASPRAGPTAIRLTPRVFIRILRSIRVGWSVPDACSSEFVTYRRFRQVCQQRPVYQKHYEKAERQRSRFRREHCEKIIQKHALTNWCAAAWWLERTAPESYSLKTVDRPEPAALPSSEQVRVIGLPQEQLDKLVGDQYKQLPNGSVERIVAGVRVVYARLDQ